MVLTFRQHLFVRSEKLCKVKQTSAEHQTKSQISSLVYAECSRTYPKLEQGVFAIFPNRRLTWTLSKLRKRAQNTKRNRRFQYRAVVSVAQVT